MEAIDITEFDNIIDAEELEESDDLTPTSKELLEEIFNLLQYPSRRDGDVTIKDIMNHRHVTKPSAADIMRRAVRACPDKYEMVKVRYNNTRWQWALRRK